MMIVLGESSEMCVVSRSVDGERYVVIQAS